MPIAKRGNEFRLSGFLHFPIVQICIAGMQIA